MVYRILIWFWLISSTSLCFGQNLLSKKDNFTHQDTLRGSITPERSWWDLTYYHLDIKVVPEKKFIAGKNTVHYKVLQSDSIMQIDLQPPLSLTKATQNGEKLTISHDGNAHYIHLKNIQKKGTINSIDVYYEGQPKVAINAPWDGGISWKKDSNNNHFIASACQGIGASIWWPCKDHMYDEVDSMLISVNVPDKLINVSNGRLRSVEQINDTKTYTWFVKNPINNYGVNINIGDYVNFSDTYKGLAGNLDLNYYVLRDHLEKAKAQFQQVPKMLKAFEYWFGQYPFYGDGYKLVEVPYLGMEHQSSITYGNKYQNGYLGRDLSGTGWGLKFDFIIIHESGHEWFANNITNKDVADLWIHEGFTSYSESLYLEYYFGKEAGAEYVIGTRKNIANNKPIIGTYNVNKEGSRDMYFKGANILHTLRQLVEDDKKWRKMLRKMNTQFHHQTVSSKQIEDYLSQQSGKDLTLFFNQYLRNNKIPTLEFSHKKRTFKYRWTNVIDGFDMPIQVSIGGSSNSNIWIFPSTKWKSMETPSSKMPIIIDNDFYVTSKEIY